MFSLVLFSAARVTCAPLSVTRVFWSIQTPSDVELHRRLGRAFTGADAAWREVASRTRHESSPFSSLTWRRGETTLRLEEKYSVSPSSDRSGE